MKPLRMLAAATLFASLSSCGGGGGDSLGIDCSSLSGAEATSSNTCAGNCNATYTGAAVDHDTGTYAILEAADSASGSVSIRATAPDGVTYEAGTPAGVIYGLTRSTGETLNSTEVINTYLDGALQESNPTGGADNVSGTDREVRLRRMETSLPFDAVELVYAQSGGTADVEIHVHEFCKNR